MTSELSDVQEYIEKLRADKSEPTLTIYLEENLEIKPGTGEAQVSGCSCDALSNSYGLGLYNGIENWAGKKMYAILSTCPIHNKE